MGPKRLVLASASPRRRDLLDRLALDFTVEPAHIDESLAAGESPAEYVTRLACTKATAVSRPDTVVVGADTAVVLDGEILGKPADREEAHGMLRRLSGRVHDVVTGVAVVATDGDGVGRTAVGTEVSRVHVDPVVDAMASWYVATDEPYDKAGGYALQGAAALFADRVEGSVSNVIGLPVPLLNRLLAGLDLSLLAFRTEAS